MQPGHTLTENRARKAPYLRRPRLSFLRPLEEVGIQLSTLQEKLRGYMVCLRSLIPGTRERCSRPTDSPQAALPPTYDIQSLMLPVKSPLETVLCSHPDITTRWGPSASSHCASTTT